MDNSKCIENTQAHRDTHMHTNRHTHTHTSQYHIVEMMNQPDIFSIITY